MSVQTNSSPPAALPTTARAVVQSTPATTTRRRPPFRLTLRGTLILLAALGIVMVNATGQILPATSDRQAELRQWLAARSTGVVAYVLLTFQVVLGLVLSHPTNRATWNLSKRIFPWHDHLWVFVMAFTAAHIITLVADPRSGVSLIGAFVPGMAQYRSSPVAIGTLAMYAFIVTAISARWTKLLPPGAWLSLHRLALVIFLLAWMHGLLAGTDSPALAWLYGGTFALVVMAGAYRYWASRQRRPTFSTSRTEDPA